jgi:hypothetical protein
MGICLTYCFREKSIHAKKSTTYTQSTKAPIFHCRFVDDVFTFPLHQISSTTSWTVWRENIWTFFEEKKKSFQIQIGERRFFWHFSLFCGLANELCPILMTFWINVDRIYFIDIWVESNFKENFIFRKILIL